ncbi:MAG: hypothetical protein KGL16_04925 [Acidobacteriota bacterium]|nr:hypothetical protein [Acidobacteriota bacterium]
MSSPWFTEQVRADRAATVRVRYVGVADWWGRHVWIERDDVRSVLQYSPGAAIGFAWGRAGLGARELARSILSDAAGDRQLAEALHVAYVHDVIAALPDDGFELDRADVLAWLGEQTG